MAYTQHKPGPHSTPAAAKPVAEARARTLQEQIRGLREQARLAGDRLLLADEHNRARVQAAWERAERACRQAEAQMAGLRAQALGNAPASSPAFDRQHPASLLPEEALQRLIRTANPHPRAVVRAASLLDPDRGCDRDQAANTAVGLLQRATETLLHNSPILDQGLTRAADTATVKAAGIDFGPLVEDAAEVPAAQRVTKPPADATAPRTAPAAPRFAVTAPAPRPVPAPRARVAPAPAPTASRSDRKKSRSRFAVTLLFGALLGGMIALASTWLVPQLATGSPWQAGLQEQGQRLQEAIKSLRQRWLPGAET